MSEILSYSINPELYIKTIFYTVFSIGLILLTSYFLPKEEYKTVLSKIIGLLLICRFLSYHIHEIVFSHWNIVHYLPLHLCGISTILSIVIMLHYNQRIFEFLVLVGIPSAIHSILSPEFTTGMDGYKFYDFYLAHGGILLVPLFLTIVLKHKINIGSWKYTFNTVLSITLIVGLLNILIHRISGEWPNYLFLCKAPIVDNPLLLVTNWPYYIPFLMFVGFLHMLFIYHIFKIFKRVEL
tara:strand:+ start:359 stop:1075 length:717 start_codon:yes stop_codon:yes gene_type:complete